MFHGRFFHRINAKHQTSIPATFREQIAEGERLHFVHSDSDCIFLYTRAGVAKLIERVREMTGRFDVEFRRLFSSDIMPVDMDAQGRIVVPADVRQQYGLADEVAFVGNMERIELWARDRWQKFEAEHREEYSRKRKRIVDVYE